MQIRVLKDFLIIQNSWGWAKITCGDGKIPESQPEYCEFNFTKENGDCVRSIYECDKGNMWRKRHFGKIPPCTGSGYQINDKDIDQNTIYLECPNTNDSGAPSEQTDLLQNNNDTSSSQFPNYDPTVIVNKNSLKKFINNIGSLTPNNDNLETGSGQLGFISSENEDNSIIFTVSGTRIIKSLMKNCPE